MSSVEDMFPGVQGSVRREKIRERYGINAEKVGGDRILPCKLDGNGHPDVNKKIIERHPLNDRRYKELENQYAKRMLTDGYDNEDAGAISLVATDSSRKSWLAIGGATRCQAFLNAIQPDNLQLDAFIKAGGYKASYYKESMPDVVVHWLVEELNVRNGLGVTNTLMQKVVSVPRYVSAFNAANEGGDQRKGLRQVRQSTLRRSGNMSRPLRRYMDPKLSGRKFKCCMAPCQTTVLTKMAQA